MKLRFIARPIKNPFWQNMCMTPNHLRIASRETGAVLLPGKYSPLPNIYCQHNHEVRTWKLIKEQGDEAIRPYCQTKPADNYGDEVLRILRRHRERPTESEGATGKILLDDLLPGFTDEPVHPFTRDERAKLIRKKCLDKTLSNKNPIML